MEGCASIYQFSATDDFTRLGVLRIYPECNQMTTIELMDCVAKRLPFKIDTIQMDNGAEFQTTLHWHVLDKGFARESIRPATPGFNGKVKRSFRMEGEEFYKFPEGVMIDDTYQLNETLQEWEKCFNDDRP